MASALADVERKNLCKVHAYVVMPNHVDILLTPAVELREITKSIKGASARSADAVLNRAGQSFWQDESFGHWVREPAEFQRIRAYIECNPVSAGLVQSPEHWPGPAPKPEPPRLNQPKHQVEQLSDFAPSLSR